MEPKLVQLHWQNPHNLRESVMVAQGEFLDDPEEFQKWQQETFAEQEHLRPEGWVAMVCDEDDFHCNFAAPASLADEGSGT